MLTVKNHTNTRSISKEYETSALLLGNLANNPIAIKNDRVVSHPINPIQNKIDQLNLKQQSATSTLPETQQFLSLQKMQKMISRFVTEKHIPIEQLAKELGISSDKLTNLNAANYETLAAELNLPLIRLYCKTKWL